MTIACVWWHCQTLVGTKIIFHGLGFCHYFILTSPPFQSVSMAAWKIQKVIAADLHSKLTAQLSPLRHLCCNFIAVHFCDLQNCDGKTAAAMWSMWSNRSSARGSRQNSRSGLHAWHWRPICGAQPCQVLCAVLAQNHVAKMAVIQRRNAHDNVNTFMFAQRVKRLHYWPEHHIWSSWHSTIEPVQQRSTPSSRKHAMHISASLLYARAASRECCCCAASFVWVTPALACWHHTAAFACVSW